MKVRLRAVQRGIGVGLIAFVAYLVIVIVTTPSLSPLDALKIAFALNWWVILGVSVGTGVQAYLIAYAKDIACPVAHSKIAVGTSGISSSLASFFSFLSLIPVGCCGTWLYILSFLPGIVGTGASGFLIGHSQQIQGVSLALIAGSVVFTYSSVKRRLKSTGRLGTTISSSQGTNTTPSHRRIRRNVSLAILLLAVILAFFILVPLVPYTYSIVSPSGLATYQVDEKVSLSYALIHCGYVLNPRSTLHLSGSRVAYVTLGTSHIVC